MNFELFKIVKRKASVFSIGGLFLSMIIYTLTLINGTMDLNAEYTRAGMNYIDSKLSFYSLPSEFVSRVPDPIFNLYTLLLFFFIIPTILSLIGSSSYYDDVQANLVNPVVSKTNIVLYVINKQICTFMITFISMLSSIIFQTIFSIVLVYLFESEFIHFKYFESGQLLSLLLSSILISIYFSLLNNLSLSLSYFISRFKSITYFIPIIISSILTFSFMRIPLALAFIYSGYKNKSKDLFFDLMLFMLLAVIILSVAFIIKNRKNIYENSKIH